MFSSKLNQYVIEVKLHGQPITLPEIEEQRHKLKSVYRNNINHILAIFVLGTVVTYRTLSLEFDSEFELFKISLYIGLWFGLFTGLMIDGNRKRRLQMVVVSMIVSTSASLFASMLAILFLGGPTNWISSINILASALGCMWVLTSYDEVLRGFDAINFVNKRQLHYIQKAASHFEELKRFNNKITHAGRQPVTAEYWAFRDWIQKKINMKKS